MSTKTLDMESNYQKMWSMAIRVWRVTIDDYSTHFDDLETALPFIRNYLRTREAPLPKQVQPKVIVESLDMEESDYRKIIEAEDAGEKVS